MMDIASVLKKDRIILDLDAKDKNEALIHNLARPGLDRAPTKSPLFGI